MDLPPPPAPAPGTNIPEYGVAEFSGAIKRTLEDSFGRVRIRGEVTEVKAYPSGHTYFALKEEGSKLRAILFKGSAARAGLKPENGVEVIATGRVTAHGDRSEYQLIVERIEYAGIGALLARVEALRVRLAAEGLFDAGRKRALPGLPARIGVVTSPAGAVIRDIMTTVARRFSRDIVVWPVRVQGSGAAEEIAAAIMGFDALAWDHPLRPDLVIVARGGGSLEDLMAFNEEIVLRAASACRIPLISAVGHETDTTLIDFISDRRAPTPTAAAELAVPSRVEKSGELAQFSARLTAALLAVSRARKMRLIAAERLIPTPRRCSAPPASASMTAPTVLPAPCPHCWWHGGPRWTAPNATSPTSPGCSRCAANRSRTGTAACAWRCPVCSNCAPANSSAPASRPRRCRRRCGSGAPRSRASPRGWRACRPARAGPRFRAGHRSGRPPGHHGRENPPRRAPQTAPVGRRDRDCGATGGGRAQGVLPL